eukprot:6475452-Amphidinium_carterae.3
MELVGAVEGVDELDLEGEVDVDVDVDLEVRLDAEVDAEVKVDVGVELEEPQAMASECHRPCMRKMDTGHEQHSEDGDVGVVDAHAAHGWPILAHKVCEQGYPTT